MSDITIDLSVEELDALHTTLGISVKNVTRKYEGLPPSYRNAEGVATELRSLISVHQKVLQCMAEALSEEEFYQ